MGRRKRRKISPPWETNHGPSVLDSNSLPTAPRRRSTKSEKRCTSNHQCQNAWSPSCEAVAALQLNRAGSAAADTLELPRAAAVLLALLPSPALPSPTLPAPGRILPPAASPMCLLQPAVCWAGVAWRGGVRQDTSDPALRCGALWAVGQLAACLGMAGELKRS